MEKVIKYIGYISTASAVLVSFAPKESKNATFHWLIYLMRSLQFELVLIAVIALIYAYRGKIRNFVKGYWSLIPEKYLVSPFRELNLYLLTIGLTIVMIFSAKDLYYIAAGRLYYYKYTIERDYRNYYIKKALLSEARGKYDDAYSYYKILFKEFPDISLKGYENKSQLIENRLEYSRTFYELSNIGLEDKKFRREDFFYLIASYKLNPQDVTVKELIKEKEQILKSNLLKAENFYDSVVNQGDDANVEFNKLKWFLFDETEAHNNKYSFEYYKDVIQSINKDEFLYRVRASWLLDNINNLISWSEELESKSY